MGTVDHSISAEQGQRVNLGDFLKVPVIDYIFYSYQTPQYIFLKNVLSIDLLTHINFTKHTLLQSDVRNQVGNIH